MFSSDHIENETFQLQAILCDDIYFTSLLAGLFGHYLLTFEKLHVKSVQSALSDLLTTSATHGTFSRPSTKRGLILIGLEPNTNARESFEHC